MSDDRYTIVIRTPDKRTLVYKGRPSELLRWMRKRFGNPPRQAVIWDAGLDAFLLANYKTLGPSEIARIIGLPATKSAVIGRHRRLVQRLPHVGEGRSMPERLGGKTGA